MFEQSIAMVTLWCLPGGQGIMKPRYTAAAEQIPDGHWYVVHL